MLANSARTAIEGGGSTGHGYMREPGGIGSAMALAAIVLQANQNMQHGGQAFPMFDYDLAPYVKKHTNVILNASTNME